MPRQPKFGVSVPIAGIAAVLCSVVGLQIGGMTPELLDGRVSLAAALTVGTLAAVVSGALGFWFGSTRAGTSGDD